MPDKNPNTARRSLPPRQSRSSIAQRIFGAKLRVSTGQCRTKVMFNTQIKTLTHWTHMKNDLCVQDHQKDSRLLRLGTTQQVSLRLCQSRCMPLVRMVQEVRSEFFPSYPEICESYGSLVKMSDPWLPNTTTVILTCYSD